MWRKKVNNNVNFEQSVIIVLNFSRYFSVYFLNKPVLKRLKIVSGTEQTVDPCSFEYRTGE
jgi:hypothetical protein